MSLLCAGADLLCIVLAEKRSQIVENGTLHPIRFKLADKEVKIEQVVSVVEEKIAGNKMLCFRCFKLLKATTFSDDSQFL